MVTKKEDTMWPTFDSESPFNSQTDMLVLHSTILGDMSPLPVLTGSDVELDCNNEETVDIALTHDAQDNKSLIGLLQFLPSTPLGPPTRGHFPGQFNFEVEINGDDTHKKKYMYSSALNKIFVNMDQNFPVQFSWDFRSAAQTMFVRATTAFADECYAQKRVERCYQHLHPRNNTNLSEEQLYHVLHSAREANGDVFYCGNQNDTNSWFSVLVQLPSQPDAGSHALSHVYMYVCKNSCTNGINRRSTEIIFTLEDATGQVFGRQTVGVQICSCPKRDMLKAEESMPVPAGKKRKAKQERETPPGKKLRAEVIPDGEDVQVFTLPPLEVVGRENFELGLKLYKKFMEASASKAANDAVYNLYKQRIDAMDHFIENM